MIKITYDAAKKKGIDLVMCGEMAGDPINLPVLVGMGLTSFSMNSASIPAVKKLIRDLDTIQAKKNVKKIMKFNTVQEISDFILNEYKEILPFAGTDEGL